MPDDNAFDKECFFIAPIGAEGSDERSRSDGVLRFIVARAAEELGLRAVRADAIAEPGQITLQVIDHVLNARAAVADLTGRNPNVYYELAIRHTARLPVVLIADTTEKLPFDIAQMRTIFFDHTDLNSADACREQIVLHLRNALGGAVESPVATSLEIRALQSGSSTEKTMGDLLRSVEELGTELARVRAEARSGFTGLATMLPRLAAAANAESPRVAIGGTNRGRLDELWKQYLSPTTRTNFTPAEVRAAIESLAEWEAAHTHSPVDANDDDPGTGLSETDQPEA